MSITITELERSIALTAIRSPVTTVLPDFNRDLVQPKLERKDGETFYVPGDKFFIEHPIEYTTYYHISQKDALIEYINRAGYRVDEVKQRPMHVPLKVDYSEHTLDIVEPEDSDFHYQNGVIDFALEAGRKHVILEVQTGAGKSAMAMKIAASRGVLTMLVTKATYLTKWIEDITEEDNSLSLKKDEVLWLKTYTDLTKLLDHINLGGTVEELGIKFILCSSHLIDGYIEKALSGNYDVVHPIKLAETLGIGTMILDESHQLFRMNYHSRLLLQVPFLIDLSATLSPNKNDKFNILRYKEAFPKKDRYTKLKYNKYIDAISLFYNIRDEKIVSRINRMSMYNHNQFETILLRKTRTRKKYFEMIERILIDMWKREREPGQRALIFFGLKKTCTEFKEWLAPRHPELNVYRYIQGDNYTEFREADVGISTYGKAGTAIDVKGLLLSIVTVPMSKDQANLQILGRTRVDRKWGRTPKAVFIHGKGIRKHRSYDNERKRNFKGKVKKHIHLEHTPFEV